MPEHRRKGVAEAMVTGITRWLLGAEPTGLGDVRPMRKEGWCAREVCLYVAEEHVARVYARCGYLVREGERDPESGYLAAFDSLELSPEYSAAQG